MTRQFDVFRHPIPNRRELYPYVIVLQHDSFGSGPELVAAPLAVPPRIFDARKLPPLEVEGRLVLLLTHELSPIPKRLLAQRLASLEASRERIVAAIDLLFVGS